MIFLTLFFALPLPFFFAWPTSGDAGTMLGNGVINAVGPMLVWSAALGFVFWGDVPTLALIVGSAVVVGSGLFLLWHETSKKSLAAD